MATEPAYQYKADVVRWIDGDTLTIYIHYGFNAGQQHTVRLHGINTPERGQAGFAEATARAVQLAPPGTAVIARSYKLDELDKYGRYVARIYVDGVDVTEVLLAEGYGVAYP